VSTIVLVDPQLLGAAFAERVATREAKVGVVGLGYAGLPIAIAFANAGFDVTGIDIDVERVAAINERRSFLVDVSEEDYDVSGCLRATADFGSVASLDAVTVCVPTPLSKTQTPDLSFVLSAVEAVAERLTTGQLLVLQSTTYPGMTSELVASALESRGFAVGTDVFLGYSPERIDPGNDRWNLRNTPRIVSGISAECVERVSTLYATVVDNVVPVSDTVVAETAKLHENTFRAVNIALANELALMCDRLGVSVWEVIEAAGTKPFGFMPHHPGPGLGGDCIPVVPHFLSWRMRQYGYSSRLIEAAHEVNAAMPLHVADRVARLLEGSGRALDGARVLLLGITYKADVSDIRESPALEVMRHLLLGGANVRYCDPFVAAVDAGGARHESVRWSAEEARAADCVVVLTPHRHFLGHDRWDDCRLVLDTRNVVPAHPSVHRL
jgi:UDP-N-acetyl-D-glucosamine dehydrogenase